MVQQIIIVVRIREEDSNAYEELFQSEVLPLLEEFKAAGKIFSASLASVVDGSEIQEGVRDFLVSFEVPSEAEHDEFDTHPRIVAFHRRVERMWLSEPVVWISEPVFRL
ncbi:MAG: hypothetical protein ACE5EW_00790 [Thermoplasmata archaeon]